MRFSGNPSDRLIRELTKKGKGKMAINTYSELHDALRKVVQEKFGDMTWIMDVFYDQNALVYEKDQKTFKTTFKIDSNDQIVLGESFEVKREISYAPANDRTSDAPSVSRPSEMR